MKNQIKARFSQEPNKKIIFKLYRIQTKSDSNKKITKPDSNKSQKKGWETTDLRMDDLARPLEASIDDLPAVPGLLVNPDLELHDIPTELVTRWGLSTSIIPLEQTQDDGNREEEEEANGCGARV